MIDPEELESETRVLSSEVIRNIVDDAIRTERERCARIAESFACTDGHPMTEIGDAIRR